MYSFTLSNIIIIVTWMCCADQGTPDDTPAVIEGKEFYLDNRQFLDEHRTRIFSKFANQIRGNMNNIYKTNIFNTIVSDVIDMRSFETNVGFGEIIARQKRFYTANNYRCCHDAADMLVGSVVIAYDTAAERGGLISAATAPLCSDVSRYGGFEHIGNTPSSLQHGTYCLVVNSQTADLCYDIDQKHYASLDCGTSLYYLATALEHSNHLASNILSTFSSLNASQVRIEEHLMGISKKLDIRISEVNDKLAAMEQRNAKNLALVEKSIQNGFTKMSEQYRKQYEDVMKTMETGFNAMSKLISEGVTKEMNRVEALQISIDSNYIQSIYDGYIMGIRKVVHRMMESYKVYVKYPNDISSRDNFAKMCSDEKPSGLARTLKDLFKQPKFQSLLIISHGHLSKIKTLLVAVTNDAGFLVTLIPACNVFKKQDNICETNFEAINQLTRLVNIIIKFIQGYDAQDVTKTNLRTSFIKTITEIGKNRFKDVNNLSYETRKNFSDDLLSALQAEGSDLRFTVIVENSEVQNENGDSYTSQIAREKLMVFASKDLDHVTIPNIKIFWHRIEHQPVGKMWQLCIDEKTHCWHDEKPHCTTKGLTTTNPWFGKTPTEEFMNLCFSEKFCKINPLETVPKCFEGIHEGKECFRRCSHISANPTITSPQGCYNEMVPCVYKNPVCAQIGVNNYNAFFPNSPAHVAINGEKCQKNPNGQKDKELDKFRYIGGYQTTSCVTNLLRELVSFDTTGTRAKINLAIVKATNFDCTTVFSFPQPGNIMEYVHQENHESKKFLFKDWAFNNLSSVGMHIENHHEMQDLGYCLLGISRTWLNESNNNIYKPALATDMRGVSEHYWGSNSKLNKFSSTDPNDKNKHAHLTYIVHNCCRGKIVKPSTDKILANYVDNCRKHTASTKTYAAEVNKEHSSFLVEVKDKQIANEKKNNEKKTKKIGIIIGAVFGCLLLLALVAGVFLFVVSRRRRNNIIQVSEKKKEGKRDSFVQSKNYSTKQKQKSPQRKSTKLPFSKNKSVKDELLTQEQSEIATNITKPSKQKATKLASSKNKSIKNELLTQEQSEITTNILSSKNIGQKIPQQGANKLAKSKNNSIINELLTQDLSDNSLDEPPKKNLGQRSVNKSAKANQMDPNVAGSAKQQTKSAK